MPAAESYPDDLRYHREHDWARVDGDTATFGVTWYAQDSLGDLVVYLPPEVGAEVQAGAEYGELESVKAVSGIVAPLSGTVTEVNQAVIDAPELVNDDPYGQGWLIRVRLRDPAELDDLLDAAGLRRARGGPLAMARLADLERAVPFSRRHIGPSPEDQERMLALLGHASLDELARAAVPSSILLGSDLDLPEALPEIDVLAELRELGHRNRVMTTMIGLGYYGTHTPQVVLRKVLENPAWYTAYTPYQPEISQGRLEALLNYQTMVCDLTGAAARERVAARRGDGRGRGDDGRAAGLEGRVQPLRGRRRRLPADARDRCGRAQSRSASRSSWPTSPRGLPDGRLLRRARAVPGRERPRARSRAADRGGPRGGRAGLRRRRPAGARPAQAAGRDGRGRRRRHVAALRRPDRLRRPARRLHERSRGLERALPGRLVGLSIDADGNPALRLALQTREQHIRREKATSNICTAQVLLAVMASMYAVYHGREGLELIAQRVHRLTAILARGLRDGGLELVHDAFFDTIRVRVPDHADAVIAAARQLGINLLRVDADTVGISCDEVTERPQVEQLWNAFRVKADIEALDAETPDAIPAGARAQLRLPHAPRLPRASLGDADAALPAHALGPRRRARPLDDPARLVHDEAQRDDRDAGRLVAGVLDDPPVRAARPGRRLRHADPRPRALAVRDHGLRRGLAAAERRLAGRVRGPARDPRLPPLARRRASATSA